MDTTQLRNILLFYLAIERALVAKFPERRGNQYCVPFHTADDAIEAISEILYYVEKDMPILNVLRNMPRYHALNLKSIVKYGTLEFRHHSGTCDRARMRAWINTIMGIVKAGELEYERVLAATSSVRGVMELIEQLYGSYAHLITGIPSVRDHISLGIADLSTILLRAQRDRDAGGLSKCDEESSLFAKKFGAKLKKSAPKKVAKAKPIGVAIDDGVAVGIQRERGVAFAQAVDAVRQLNLDNHRRNR